MSVDKMIEDMTLRRLMMNIDNDLREDGDTGINLDMTVKEYLELLISYSND